MQITRLFGLLIVVGLFASPGFAGTGGPHSKSSPALASARILDTVITFSEFPVDTPITTQYANKGIIFGGDSPFITTDIDNPTSPVLSGTPKFSGAIEGSFVNADTGRKVAQRRFEMDAGYFNAPASVRITLYDKKGNEILRQKNTQLGIQHFVFKNLPTPVHKFRIQTIGDEPFGYAIDNVAFKRKPPLP
jgi:hypothetical protein